MQNCFGAHYYNFFFSFNAFQIFPLKLIFIKYAGNPRMKNCSPAITVVFNRHNKVFKIENM